MRIVLCSIAVGAVLSLVGCGGSEESPGPMTSSTTEQEDAQQGTSQGQTETPAVEQEESPGPTTSSTTEQEDAHQETAQGQSETPVQEQDTPPSAQAFEASRRWWIAQVEIADGSSGVKIVRMHIVFRDPQDLASVEYGIGEGKNGWEGDDAGVLVYQESWGTDEVLDEQGMANCQLNCLTGGDLQRVIDRVVFRLDGEESWTRLADYVGVAEDEPNSFVSRRCPQCWALFPVDKKTCENCGLDAEE